MREFKDRLFILFGVYGPDSLFISLIESSRLSKH